MVRRIIYVLCSQVIPPPPARLLASAARGVLENAPLLRRLKVRTIVLASVVGTLALAAAIHTWRGLLGTFLLLQFVAILALLAVAVGAADRFSGSSAAERAISECISFGACMLLIGVVVFGTAVFSLSTLYLALTAVAIIGGGHLVNYQLDYSLRRIRAVPEAKMLGGCGTGFELVFNRGRRLYWAVPLGMASGTIIAMARRSGSRDALTCGMVATAVLAGVFLVYLVAIDFKRLCTPMFADDDSRHPTAEQAERDFTIASLAGELRSAILFESLHNAIILLTCIFGVSAVAGFDLEGHGPLLVVAAIVTLAFLNQLPFFIGQTLLHHRVLFPYKGTTHSELSKKLKDYVSTKPPWGFLGSQFAAGTCGGLLLSLMVDMLKGALKPK